MAAYLEAVIEKPVVMELLSPRRLRIFAHAKEMTSIARELGLSHESLYKGCLVKAARVWHNIKSDQRARAEARAPVG